jgi:N-acetylglucosamine-6-sulfatase
MRRALLLVMAVAVAVSLPIGCGAVPAQEAEKPNIILILTDDQESGSLAHMPRVKAELIEQGTTFKNGFVTDPLCCPSRASILRGQYVHNHGVKGNVEPSAHDAFRDLGRENSTIATWLQDEGGYRTALIGKYMNAYDQLYVPPGWDYWFAGHGSGKYRYFNNNGTRVDYPNESPSTDILAERLFAYLDGTEGDPRPFFLYLATHDPHMSATPPARYAGTFADESLPKPPSFNERDVSDKPAWVRNRSLLSEAKIANMRDHYRKRLESLQAVDEMVGELVEKLTAQGKLENTYIFYTSDNGYHMGQHRLPSGKTTPYEEDIKVPYVVRGPGVPAGRTLGHMVLNNDLAPTFAELGGVPAPSFVDGRSLLPLLSVTPPAPSDWRGSFLVENYATQHKGLDYRAVRTRGRVFVRYASGERELYNLRKDPYQLANRQDSAGSTLLSELNSKLDALKACAGDSCRTAEGT